MSLLDGIKLGGIVGNSEKEQAHRKLDARLVWIHDLIAGSIDELEDAEKEAWELGCDDLADEIGIYRTTLEVGYQEFPDSEERIRLIFEVDEYE